MFCIFICVLSHKIPIIFLELWCGGMVNSWRGINTSARCCKYLNMSEEGTNIAGWFYHLCNKGLNNLWKPFSLPLCCSCQIPRDSRWLCRGNGSCCSPFFFLPFQIRAQSERLLQSVQIPHIPLETIKKFLIKEKWLRSFMAFLRQEVQSCLYEFFMFYGCVVTLFVLHVLLCFGFMKHSWMTRLQIIPSSQQENA